MKRFINWCNRNGGFLAFIAIIVAIVIAIFTSVKISIPKFLEFLGIVFLTSIKVPISLLVLILILIWIILRRNIPIWSRIFVKTVKSKVVDIISDRTTIFTGSSRFKSLKSNCESFEFRDGGYWTRYPQFDELVNCYWIANTKLITDDEAIKGGDYEFQKEFKLSNVADIEKAVIYLIVDDKCKISLNDSDLGEFLGFDNLNEIDIKNYLTAGYNKLNFKVLNNPGLVLSTDAYSDKANIKGSLNPYGLKYLLRIIYK